MRKSNFGLKILNGLELSTGNVVLDDGAVYSLRLVNYDEDLRCDAIVRIDGEFIGRFRIEPFSAINVKRPVKDDKSFIFRKIYSMDNLGFIDKNKKDLLGYIDVEFIPEDKSKLMVLNKHEFNIELERGYTDFGESSGQIFKPTERMQLKYEKSINLRARLVGVDSER